MKFRQVTEENSLYDNLEQQPVRDLLRDINREDHRVADAVEACLPQVEAFVVRALPRIQQGGRLFYIGAGTSGRLGVLDASEIPPYRNRHHCRRRKSIETCGGTSRRPSGRRLERCACLPAYRKRLPDRYISFGYDTLRTGSHRRSTKTRTAYGRYLQQSGLTTFRSCRYKHRNSSGT